MVIRINATGWLEIKRHGQFKEQSCPFTATESGQALCGDWCPLFYYEKEEATLHLCQKASWNITECIDERGETKNVF